MGDILSDFYEEHASEDTKYCLARDHDDDLFSIFDTRLEADVAGSLTKTNDDDDDDESVDHITKQGQETTLLLETELVSTSILPKSCKRPKLELAAGRMNPSEEDQNQPEEQQRMSHIAVERNRRKQMNGSLSVLRSLMPHFYVKRGDQASIIEGVIDYINEMQEVLKHLENKKHRKVNYTSEVILSPRLQQQQVSSTRPSPARSPIKLPPNPRLNLAVSPRTPQLCSPYRDMKPWLHQAGYLSPATATITTAREPSSSRSSSSSITSSINESSSSTVNELVANSRSPIAEVGVNFSGPNLVLKTISPRIPGQAVKIISVLEDLSLQVLHLSIRTVEETVVKYSFTIEVGIECQLSAEELAQQIQQTFSIN